MTEQRKVRSLSDVVVAGRDYPAKVTIKDVLDHEVLMTGFTNVIIMKEVITAEGEKVEVEDANYWNIDVDDNSVLKTFSTGAVPIAKILARLDEDYLPLLCTFRKQGRTYVVE